MELENRTGKLILDKFYRNFLERNSHLHVYSAHHMDENRAIKNDFIPATTGNEDYPPVYHWDLPTRQL